MSKPTNICESKTFESIYHTYVKDLRRFIFYKTQDTDLTEDIVQETFIKLWDNCSNVTYEKVKSYLFTVANNSFLNIKKHESVVRKHKQTLTNPKTNESPEFIFLEKEFLEKLEETIGELPSKQKEVFLMNRIEKKKYNEIAVELNISVKAVEKRMHSALVYLRDKIGNI